MNRGLITFWKENRGLLVFLLLMFMFRSAIADWNEVPTSSMKPTIVEGDRILVNKLAYDIRVPFTKQSLVKLADPMRGDIIIFDSEVSDKRLVKRVVGVPGDMVELTDNKLIINGKPLQYQTVLRSRMVKHQREDLLGIQHDIWVRESGSQLSNFTAVRVPQGYYLVLGDNRDNSADSRVIGLIPRGEIIGRSKRVVMSLNYDNYYIPRRERFLHPL
ncbi:MAG: signal peptidase I [Granulosicoccus sp.]|nr:signal peptidase I [Granulosicoccus sp.]